MLKTQMVAFSSSSDLIACRIEATDTEVWLWKRSAAGLRPQKLQVLRVKGSSTTNDLVFLKDDKFLASLSDTGYIIQEIATRTVYSSVKTWGGSIRHLVFSPDNTSLQTEDGEIALIKGEVDYYLTSTISITDTPAVSNGRLAPWTGNGSQITQNDVHRVQLPREWTTLKKAHLRNLLAV